MKPDRSAGSKGLLALLDYQRDYVMDGSRFKVWLASRQVGKSFAAALEAVIDCVTRPGAHWVILSAGERQAIEFMEKVKQHARAIGLAISGWQDERAGGTEYKAAGVRFANGSRITALPANPDTARGYSANIILDEFALHGDAEAIWRAVYPSITNPLRGELKVRVLSTPNGQGNKFHQIWSDASQPGSQWSRHRTTIHDALAAGLNVDVATLRKAAGDAATWSQEYECEFLDAGGILFPYEIITRCESPLASVTFPDPAPEGPFYCGIDLGTAHDPTYAVTLQRIEGGRYVVCEALHLPQTDLSDQETALAGRIARAAIACLDQSGLGRQMGQNFARRFGGKFRGIDFTAKWKHEAFPALARALADRLILLPDDRDLREDLHSWTVAPGTPHPIYSAPRTARGHSDFTAALCLAWHAATGRQAPALPKAFGGDPRTDRWARAAVMRGQRR